MVPSTGTLNPSYGRAYYTHYRTSHLLNRFTRLKNYGRTRQPCVKVAALVDAHQASSQQDKQEPRVFHRSIAAKVLRAVGIGLAVSIPILLMRPAPAKSQLHVQSGAPLATEVLLDRAQSSLGASCSSRCSVEAEGEGRKSTCQYGSHLHTQPRRHAANLLGDLAALDDASSVYGSGMQSKSVYSSSGAMATPGQSNTTSQATDALAALAAQDQVAMQVFDYARPSVVNVTHMRSMQSISTLDAQRPPLGHASGLVWDSRGTVVTSYRLVRGAAEMKVTLQDHNTYTAKVVGFDAAKDLAVLKLSMPKSKARELTPASLGSAGGLHVGQSVFLLGNAMGLDHTLSRGMVCGLGRDMGVGMMAIRGCIMSDALVEPGGGALLDMQGRVVGICTAAPDAGSTSPGRAAGCYALPVDTARCLVDQILLHGRVVRPALGVTLAPPDILASHAMDGVLVLEVPAGYAAHAAGLRPTHRDIFGQLILGDVIVALDGRPVANAMELGQALDEKRVGQRVGVAVLRDGKQMNLTLTLGERVLGVVDD